MNPGSRKFLLYWLPALLWMPLVLGASSDPFSAEHTGQVLKVFFGWMQPEPFNLLHFMIRKLAHLSEYGILAFLFFRAWRGARPGWQMLWAQRAFACCLVVAALDEFHQGYVASRTSSLRDVAIDACGALVVLAIVRWRTRHSSKIVLQKV